MGRAAGEDVVEAPEARQDASQASEGTEVRGALVCGGSGVYKEAPGSVQSGGDAACGESRALTADDDKKSGSDDMKRDRGRLARQVVIASRGMRHLV
ncbi:hypothetical protein GN244_ATG11932 [Phytophthora infestans]|uniref:Uncharacterized protein n=1 Tax=Phytophthora infestans TaxID=4787 RepID=A0A833SNY2_PHYIN|nr:hypothetical protein GN244_ATG11932 [Phytophthora infestans]KAF4147627.1 hypothetical protein GN958_ATG03200 [Phytophthora infestans]